jgi:outer membrane protein OmpA-like peptidoglycan-associated protein
MLIVASCSSNKKVVKIPIQVIESDHTDKVFLSEPMVEDTVKALITEKKGNKEGVPDTLLSKRTLTVNVKKQEPVEVPLCDTCIEKNRREDTKVSEPYVSSRDTVRGKVEGTKSDTIISDGSVVSSDTTKGNPIPSTPKIGEMQTIKDTTVEINTPLPSDWMFGVKGGINLSHMDVDTIGLCCGVEQVGWLSGEDFAPLLSLFAKWRVNDGFTFMPELMYNKYIFSLPAIDYELRLHYLTFRPNFVFNIISLDDAKTWNLYGHFAPSLGFLVNNSSVKSGGSELATSSRDFNDIDFGANFGAGITKMFGDAFELGFDVSYTRSFTDNNRRTDVDAGNNFYRFNQGIEVALTLAIPLPKSAPTHERTIEKLRIDEKIETITNTVRERVRDTVNINFYNGVRVDEITINTSTDITKTLIIDSMCYKERDTLRDTIYKDTCLNVVDRRECIPYEELYNYGPLYVCNRFLCISDNYYEFDKSKITNTGNTLHIQLDTLIKFLRKEGNREVNIQIYGHTDSAGIYPYCEGVHGANRQSRDNINGSLSQRRAETAANYIKEKAPDLSKRIKLVKGAASAYPASGLSYNIEKYAKQKKNNLSADKAIPDNIKDKQEREQIKANLKPGENYRNRRVEIRFVCGDENEKTINVYPTTPEGATENNPKPYKNPETNKGGK